VICHEPTFAFSFDHFVSTQQKRGWHRPLDLSDCGGVTRARRSCPAFWSGNRWHHEFARPRSNSRRSVTPSVRTWGYPSKGRPKSRPRSELPASRRVKLSALPKSRPCLALEALGSRDAGERFLSSLGIPATICGNALMVAVLAWGRRSSGKNRRGD
jgi:hypothetical protein